MCLSDVAIMDYLGNGKEGHGLHISKLTIYEKPRELSEFRRVCANDLYCESCAMYQATNGACGNRALYLRKPPVSWCYVEEPTRSPSSSSITIPCATAAGICWRLRKRTTRRGPRWSGTDGAAWTGGTTAACAKRRASGERIAAAPSGPRNDIKSRATGPQKAPARQYHRKRNCRRGRQWAGIPVLF